MAKQQVPKTLGRYKLIREIGRGAMGIVYEGIDPVIGRRVAIKAARRDLLDGEERADEMMERFIREAHAAGQLNHPGIITIYDADQEKDVAFIAMEFMTGGSLKDRLRDRGRLEPKEAVKIGVAICSALAAAHDQDVVHRDVKPANILMHSDGSIKVADFGIAHVSDSTLTQDGAIVGTPYCMSPEQVMGKKVDGRSDLFSVGVILYEMLTGQRPFTGDAFGAILHKIVNEDPIPPHDMCPGLNENLSLVVMKALSKAPERRYQDGRMMAAALRESLKEEPDFAVLGLDDTMTAPPRIPQHDVSTVLSMLTPEQRAAVGFEEPLQERVGGGVSSFSPRVSRFVKRGTLLPAIVTTLFLLIVGIMIAVTVIGRQPPAPNATDTAPSDKSTGKDVKSQDSKPGAEEKSRTPGKSKKERRTPRKAEVQKSKDSEPEQQQEASKAEPPAETPKQPSEPVAPAEKTAEVAQPPPPAEHPVQVAKVTPETPAAPSQPEQSKPPQQAAPVPPLERPAKAQAEQPAPPPPPDQVVKLKPEQAAPPKPPGPTPAAPVAKEKPAEPVAPPPPPAIPPAQPATNAAQPPAPPHETVPPATVLQPPVPPATPVEPLPKLGDDVNALAQFQGAVDPQPAIPLDQAQGLLSVLPSVGKLTVTLWFADTREAWDAALNTQLAKDERYTQCKTSGTVTAVVRDATSPTQPIIDTQVIISASTMLVKTPCPQISVTFQREGYKSVERQYSADCPNDSITDDVVMRSLTLGE